MFLVPDVIWEHYSNEFFYTQKKTQLAFREYLAVQIKNAIGTIPPGGVWGGGAPPTCRPPSFLVVAAAAAEQKSCFDLAENYGASSLWIGDQR